MDAGTKIGTKTRLKTTPERMVKRNVINVTVSEINALVAGLFDTACLIIHERAPRMSIPMVRAVFDRRLATNRPAASAILRRIQGKAGK